MRTSEPFPVRRFLAPRHWPTWAGLGLLRLVARLPFGWQLRLGKALGWLLWLLPLSTKRVARTNLRLCFPELDDREREDLLRAHYASLGISVFEFAMAWWAPDQNLRSLAHVEGLDNLQDALAEGKGVILLGMHFTNLELSGRLLRQYIPFAVMYRPQNNALFDLIMRRARERIFTRAIPRDDVRGLIRGLKDNLPVWYAPDQNYAGKQRVFASFFGIPASTNSGTARLARMTGSPMLPFTHIRLPDGQGYRLILGPRVENFPSGDPERDTQCINKVIEEQVRKAPEQYLWVHRRFKDRPPGSPDYYSS